MTPRRRFGTSWWGRAWVAALEGRAALDPNRLPRGRSYARSGAVGPLELAAGEVRAAVRGSRPTPYRVRVRVRVFSGADWDRLLDAVAARIGHLAALLDGELPPEVVADVAAAGLDLLPGPGELQPRCSCPDWADPCKHAAAVCYLVADRLDEDPFDLLLLRGRSRAEVLAGLRARRSAGGGPRPGADPVGDAVAASAVLGRPVGPLPRPPLPPDRPGPPAALVAPPAELAAGLRELATDAAERAWALALGSGDGGLGLTVEADLARRAAGLPPGAELAALADRSGRPARELARAASAWRFGGAAGLATLRESWQPAPDELADGRRALGPGARTRANRVTLGERQLRLGRDGCWYPFVRGRGGWEPAGPGGPDPAAALAGGRPRLPGLARA